MTTHKKVRKRVRSVRSAIFPICGAGRGSIQTNWSPAAIARHEQDCPKCHRLAEVGLAARQSEYRTRLDDAPAGEEPPFDVD